MCVGVVREELSRLSKLYSDREDVLTTTSPGRIRTPHPVDIVDVFTKTNKTRKIQKGSVLIVVSLFSRVSHILPAKKQKKKVVLVVFYCIVHDTYYVYFLRRYKYPSSID